MVQFTHALAAALLATGAIAHGDVNKEILRRRAHLEHPYRRSVLDCKRDLEASGWARKNLERREARLNELRVEAGFAKRDELARREPQLYNPDARTAQGCTTLDQEQTEGPYCEFKKIWNVPTQTS